LNIKKIKMEELKKKSGGKKILNYLIFLLIVTITAYFWQLSVRDHPSPKNIEKEAYINLVFSFDNQEKIQLQYPYSVASPDNLFSITKDIAKTQNWTFNFDNYESMGILVTQIGADKNGTDQKYWQYTSNGLTPLVSVDNFYPQANDTVEWTFKLSEM